MKKVLSIFAVLFMLGNIAFAEELANQEMNVNDNKAVVMVQKQPTQSTSTQKQAVKNNWFCIVIQVNGKIQETNKGD